MRFRFELKHALKFLNASKGILGIITFQTAFGLTALFAVTALKTGFQTTLQNRSQSLVGADLVLSSRAQVDPNDLALAESEISTLTGGSLEKSRLESLELFSMLSQDSNAAVVPKMVQAVGIETGYPFYGKIELKKPSVFKPLLENEALIEPSLAELFQVKVGDPLKLGQLKLTITGIISTDESTALGGMSLAPKLYLRLNDLKNSGLIQPGSTSTRKSFYKIKPELWTKSKALAFVKGLNQKLKDPALQVTSHFQGGEQSGRALSYLQDFLGLCVLISLALSWIANLYFFKLLLKGRTATYALFRLQGFTSIQVLRVFFYEFGFIQLLVFALSLLCAPLVLQALNQALTYSMGTSLTEILPNTFLSTNAFWAYSLLWIGNGLATLSLLFDDLFEIYSSRPLRLLGYQELTSLTQNSFNKKAAARSIIGIAISLAWFWILAAYETRSWIMSSSFVGILVVSALALWGAGSFGLSLGSRFLRLLKHPLLYLTASSVTRNRTRSLTAILALGLGCLLLSFLHLIEGAVKREAELDRLQGTRGEQILRPSLFLFDIQENQILPLNAYFKTNQIEPLAQSPLVRARLISVNGKAFEKSVDTSATTREAEQEARFRNRGINLSYRAGLSESESIVSGEPFSKENQTQVAVSDQLFQASVEYRFAERLFLKLNDLLEFDVQGITLKAKIKNLRRVQWTSFQPNFFIILEPGAIDDAPKTYLMTLPLVESLEKLNALKMGMARDFPNISFVDVGETAKKTLGWLTQMSGILKIMGLICLISGLWIVTSLAHYQRQMRQNEFFLYRMLGVMPKQVRLIFTSEWLALTLLSGVGGLLLSLIATVFLLNSMLEISLNWGISEALAFALWGALLVLGLCLGLIGSTLISEKWTKTKL